MLSRLETHTMNPKTSFFPLAFLLIAAPISFATLPEFTAQIKQSPQGSKPSNQRNKGGGYDAGFGGFFGPGSGFSIPGFGSGSAMLGGGYGSGFGGPSGGSSGSGVIRPTIVCREKGPCYKKKLICPAKCFTSYSRSGKGYGGGGGGGGCTVDCKKRCTAYC